MDETLTSTTILQRYAAGERNFFGLEVEDPAGATPLKGAVLDDVNFSGAFLVINFEGASLRRARFVGANVKTCLYSNADLRAADFTGACLDGATFVGARLERCKFDGATVSGHAFSRGETPRW
jgi:uncharacterized protein YjbI with pentapeptide repeats